MLFASSNNPGQSVVSAPISGPYALRLSGLWKAFREVRAVADVGLALERGEILCLLGPSGCGKTTMLRLIAGFETPDDGTIHIGDRLVYGPGANVSPDKRRVGMVFQEGALFPHLTVAQNVAFGLAKGKRRQAQVAEALQLVNLAGYDGRYPHQLSGGQQQRVALARALAPEPDLILMDEPFSSLDTGLRSQLRTEVRAILKEREATVVCVTHDQEEAMHMGDRIAVMNEGRIEQLGPPERVFNHPGTRFAAEFFGTSDFIPAWRDGAQLVSEVGRGPWLETWPTPSPGSAELQVMVRPDCLDMTRDAGGNGVVRRREYLGAFNLYSVELSSGRRVRVMKSHIARFEPGAPVRIFLRQGHRLLPFVNGHALGDELDHGDEPDHDREMNAAGG